MPSVRATPVIGHYRRGVTHQRIRAIVGDITTQSVDAIVNAANDRLSDGAGVNGAIQRAAGPELLAECGRLGGCPTGQARITGGYDLPAAHVIHAVGPVYRDGRSGEPELLAAAHDSSLRLADHHGLRSIAFPAISCGIYGYPIGDAARIAVDTTRRVLPQTSLDEVVFVLFDDRALDAYQQALAGGDGSS